MDTIQSKATHPVTREDLYELICEVTGLNSVTPVIERQVFKYITELKMTYKEIARCIVWYVEVEGKKFDKSYYGIGVVPNIREQANKYFEKLKKDQEEKQRQAEEAAASSGNNIIFNISSLEHKRRKPKSFDISKIDVGEEETTKDHGEHDSK